MRWCATDNAWVQRTISSSWSSPSIRWSQRTEHRWPAWQQMLLWLSYFTGPSFPASTLAFRRILVCEGLLNIYIPIPRFSPIHLRCDWLRYSCRIKWNLAPFLPPYKHGFVGRWEWRSLPPSLWTRVRALQPTWWEERASSHRVSFHSHTWVVAHVHPCAHALT